MYGCMRNFLIIINVKVFYSRKRNLYNIQPYIVKYVNRKNFHTKSISEWHIFFRCELIKKYVRPYLAKQIHKLSHFRHINLAYRYKVLHLAAAQNFQTFPLSNEYIFSVNPHPAAAAIEWKYTHTHVHKMYGKRAEDTPINSETSILDSCDIIIKTFIRPPGPALPLTRSHRLPSNISPGRTVL